MGPPPTSPAAFPAASPAGETPASPGAASSYAGYEDASFEMDDSGVAKPDEAAEAPPTPATRAILTSLKAGDLDFSGFSGSALGFCCFVACLFVFCCCWRFLGSLPWAYGLRLNELEGGRHFVDISDIFIDKHSGSCTSRSTTIASCTFRRQNTVWDIFGPRL